MTKKSRTINSETKVLELSVLLLHFRTMLGIKLENSFNCLLFLSFGIIIVSLNVSQALR